jgi:DnaJ-class molecular chaperone
MCVEGLGMPFHKTPYKYGNLFINFKIKFPEKLNDNQIDQVKTVLSGQAKSKNMINAIKSVEKIEMLVPFEESQKNTHA